VFNLFKNQSHGRTSKERAFEKVLNKPIRTEAAIPPFVLKVIFPILSIFKGGMGDSFK